MITRILLGDDAIVAASSLLNWGAVVACQDLAPEHVNTVRVALPLPDSASPSAQTIYCDGLRTTMATQWTVAVVDDDYLTYGSPLDRPWVTASQS